MHLNNFNFYLYLFFASASCLFTGEDLCSAKNRKIFLRSFLVVQANFPFHAILKRHECAFYRTLCLHESHGNHECP